MKNKKGERQMKNLSNEEINLIINKLNLPMGVPTAFQKYLKPIKNPSEHTKQMIEQAQSYQDKANASREACDKLIKILQERA
jgi:hypothetical protein